jgi:hypothetical protein
MFKKTTRTFTLVKLPETSRITRTIKVKGVLEIKGDAPFGIMCDSSLGINMDSLLKPHGPLTCPVLSIYKFKEEKTRSVLWELIKIVKSLYIFPNDPGIINFPEHMDINLLKTELDDIFPGIRKGKESSMINRDVTRTDYFWIEFIMPMP